MSRLSVALTALLTAGLAGLWQPALAYEVTIYYVAKSQATPSGAPSGSWGAAKAWSASGGNGTGMSALTSDTDAKTLQASVKSLTQGKLNTFLGPIFGIRNKDVDIYVFSDFQGINQATKTHYDTCTSTAGTYTGVWPCAWIAAGRGKNPSGPHNEPKDNGKIVLGELHAQSIARSEGQAGWEATIVHEAVHTQDLGDWDEHAFGPAYGKDGVHYYREVLNDPRAAFQEGIANFAGMQYSSKTATRYLEMLNKNGVFVVENPSKVRTRIQNECGTTPFATSKQVTGGKSYNYDHFRWIDLCGTFLMKNEMAIAATLYHAAQNSTDGYKQIMKAFRSTNIKSRTFYTLFGELVAETTLWQNTVGGHGHMFMLGVVDLVTHFDYDERAFITDSSLEAKVVRDYLTNYRPILKKEFEPKMSACKGAKTCSWDLAKAVARLKTILQP